MANVQKENGYTSTANELIEAICRLEVSGSCHRILRFIERKTYGYQKKEDAISFTQFETGTGMYRSTVNDALNTLIEIGVIEKLIGGYTNHYKINKDYEKWTSSQKQTSSQNQNETSSQTTTKTSSQKQTYKRKKEINKYSDSTNRKNNSKNMGWKSHNENDHTDDIPSIDADSGEKIRDKADEQKEESKKISHNLGVLGEARGKKFLDIPTQRSFYIRLLKAGLTHRDIGKQFMDLVDSSYWVEKKKQGQLPDLKSLYSIVKNKT